jgi:bacteriorhodopsin
LPVAFAAIAMTVFYSVFNKGAFAAKYQERTIASIILIVVTYGVMLPLIYSKTKIVDEKEIKLIDISVKWFAFQVVPLLVMTVYNSSKAAYEKRIALEKENAAESEPKQDDSKEENN